MQNLLRELFLVAGLMGLITYILIPVWFFSALIGLAVSTKRRASFRSRWPVFIALGVATVVILYITDLFPRQRIPFPDDSPVPKQNARDAIDEADAIVEGSFLRSHTVSSTRGEFDGPFYHNLRVDTFVVPFQIEASAKGPTLGAINVRLYFTPYPNTPFYTRLPLAERMLVLLRRDPHDSATWIMVNEANDWLILAQPHDPAALPEPPAAFVLDDAKRFLTACLDQPDLTARIAYMNQPTVLGTAFTLLDGGFSTLSYPENDPARRNALRMGKDLGLADPEFLALARRYENAPQDLGQIARSVRTDSGDYSGLQARLSTATHAPPLPAPQGFRLIGDPAANIPHDMYQAILDAPDMEKIMPVVQEALASSDPKLREETADGLYQRQGKARSNLRSPLRLPDDYAPLLVSLLDDGDDKVQYDAMGTLFYLSGEMKKRVPDREVNLPAIWLWQQHKNDYLAKAKAWWQKHKAEFSAR
jgi:hypothetical protein